MPYDWITIDTFSDCGSPFTWTDNFSSVWPLELEVLLGYHKKELKSTLSGQLSESFLVAALTAQSRS